MQSNPNEKSWVRIVRRAPQLPAFTFFRPSIFWLITTISLIRLLFFGHVFSSQHHDAYHKFSIPYAQFASNQIATTIMQNSFRYSLSRHLTLQANRKPGPSAMLIEIALYRKVSLLAKSMMRTQRNPDREWLRLGYNLPPVHLLSIYPSTGIIQEFPWRKCHRSWPALMLVT